MPREESRSGDRLHTRQGLGMLTALLACLVAMATTAPLAVAREFLRTGFVVLQSQSADFETTGTVGGPFPGRARTYTVENLTDQTITWTAYADVDWIEFSISGGDLEPGESVEVVASVDPNAVNALPEGEYAARMVFRNVDAEEFDQREIACRVHVAPPQPGLNVSPGDDFQVSLRVGDAFLPDVRTYTLSNTSDAPLAWHADKNAEWFELSQSSGELQPGETTEVSVRTIRTRIAELGVGAYDAEVAFTNDTSGMGSTSRGCNLALAASSGLGINLMKVVDWTTEIPFKDCFKEARGWISHGPNYVWDTGLPIDTDAMGWVKSLLPGQEAGTLMFNGMNGRYPAGTYTVLWDGNGTVKVDHDAVVTSQQAGRMTLSVAHPTNAGIHLKITATDPANYVRNIKVIMPGQMATYATQPFHPVYTDLIDDFGVLRFMDWGLTNNSPVVNWADRTTPNHAFQSREQGVAPELMIQLANYTKCDPWICIPHRASDDYVTQLATLVRNTLDPARKVYVEYSNEVWNSGFSQSQYAQQQGLALGLSTNPFQAQLRFYSKRSVEIFQIFRAVFGAQQSRVVRVLAGQAANPWTGETIMDWNGASTKADVYAVAPYFGNSLGNASTQFTVSTWTLDRLFSELQLSMTQMMTTNAQNVNAANSRGLRLVAYEGGQHLVGIQGAENNVALSNLFMSANRDPRMKAIYFDYLTRWKNQGGQLFTIFNCVDGYSKWGSWGMLEYMDANRIRSHKYQGILQFMAANPLWW